MFEFLAQSVVGQGAHRGEQKVVSRAQDVGAVDPHRLMASRLDHEIGLSIEELAQTSDLKLAIALDLTASQHANQQHALVGACLQFTNQHAPDTAAADQRDPQRRADMEVCH
ncbi:MAG: hypothetical protein RR240_11710 [Burkholderiaceae bacterium]